MVGASAAHLPIGGGVLIPAPDLVVPLPTTDALGAWSLVTGWPAGIPTGTPFYLQVALVDGLAPSGFAGSHGWRGLTP